MEWKRRELTIHNVHHNRGWFCIRRSTSVFATVVGIHIPDEQIVGERLSVLSELRESRFRVEAEELSVEIEREMVCGQKLFLALEQFNPGPSPIITLFLKCQFVWLGGSGEYLMIHVRLIVEPCVKEKRRRGERAVREIATQVCA